MSCRRSTLSRSRQPRIRHMQRDFLVRVLRFLLPIVCTGKSIAIMATPTNFDHYTAWTSSKYNRRPEDYEMFKKTLTHALWELALIHFPLLHDKVEFIGGGTP